MKKLLVLSMVAAVFAVSSGVSYASGDGSPGKVPKNEVKSLADVKSIDVPVLAVTELTYQVTEVAKVFAVVPEGTDAVITEAIVPAAPETGVHRRRPSGTNDYDQSSEDYNDTGYRLPPDRNRDDLNRHVNWMDLHRK